MDGFGIVLFIDYKNRPFFGPIWTKLGQIHSNLFEFQNFELQRPNLSVEFGRIWILRTNLVKFDLFKAKFDLFKIQFQFFKAKIGFKWTSIWSKNDVSILKHAIFLS